MTTYARLRLPSCHDALFQAIRLIPVLAILAGALPRDAEAVIALVKNVGTAHFRLRNVQLSGDGNERSTHWVQTVPAWYMLPGDERSWDYELPPGVCDGLSRLSVEFEGDEVGGRTTVAVPGGACPEAAE